MSFYGKENEQFSIQFRFEDVTMWSVVYVLRCMRRSDCDEIWELVQYLISHEVIEVLIRAQIIICIKIAVHRTHFSYLKGYYRLQIGMINPSH